MVKSEKNWRYFIGSKGVGQVFPFKVFFCPLFMCILNRIRRVRKKYIYTVNSGGVGYNLSGKSNLTCYSLCEQIKVEMSLKKIITKKEICRNIHDSS